MEFAVAGGVLLLTFVTGLVSFLAVPRYEKQKEEAEDGTAPEKLPSPAMALPSFFKRNNWKQWTFLAVVSILCGALIGVYSRNESDWFSLIRQVSVLLLLFSSMIIDHKTHLIPNASVLTSLGAGAVFLVLEFFFSRETFLGTLITSVVGFLFCLILFYLLSRVTKEGIGMGDVKLIAVMGWMLGLSVTMASILFALILCTAVAIALLFGKKKKRNDMIPFGPFMFFGYILMFVIFSL